MKKTIVHKQGKDKKTENYNQQKLHSSILATCLSVNIPDGQAEHLAELVTGVVTRWTKDKTDITSQDIRIKAAEALNIHNPDAAYIYKNNQRIV